MESPSVLCVESSDIALAEPLSAATPFEVVAVETASDALEALTITPFDCLLCGESPREDGLATLEAVRAEHPDLPVLLWTPYPDGKTAAKATRLDVSEYIALSMLDADPESRAEQLGERIHAIVETAATRQEV